MLIFQGSYCGKMIIDQIKDLGLLFIKISMQVNNCGKGSQSIVILGQGSTNLRIPPLDLLHVSCVIAAFCDKLM